MEKNDQLGKRTAFASQPWTEVAEGILLSATWLIHGVAINWKGRPSFLLFAPYLLANGGHPLISPSGRGWPSYVFF